MSELARTPAREVYMNETDPAIVDRQIAEGLRFEAETGRPFLNNFDIKLLPAGIGGFYPRTVVDNLGALDQPMVRVEDAGQTDGTSGLLTRSDKALQTTWREFFANCDLAMSETGISIEDVIQLHAARKPQGITPDARIKAAEARTALREKILPAYRWLRQKGYSHSDLWI